MARRIQRRKERATPEEIASRKVLAYRIARRREGWFSRRDVATQLAGDPNIGRTLSLLVAERKLRVRGERRSTQYLVRG